MKSSIKYLVCAGLISFAVHGQKTQIAKADKEYDKYDYVDAIKVYERVYEKGYKSPELLKKLGNAYYFQAKLDKANTYYADLFSSNQSVEPEYYYRYAQTLKAVKDYPKADQMLAEFAKRSKSDVRAQLASKQKDYLEEIKRNSGRYTVENAGINSSKQDYGAAYYNNKIVFASARDTGGISNREHDWNGEAFTNLYQAEIGAEGALSKPEKFSKKINTKFHESTPVFTKDSNTVYFTRNNYNDGKRGRDTKKTTLLKLYKATFDGTDWVDVKELPFNSDDYSVAHPALSPDEKTLYFASDMTGTKGQSDLWKVAITGEDSYGTPENLTDLNTEGRETFPFITPENELFFASDGQPGLGGLDIYMAKTDGNGGFTNPRNVGEPLNSSMDDFAYYIDNKTKYGYVTSNRAGGMGSDDIYRFKQNQELPAELCEQALSGVVTDEATGEPIPNAKVSLMDSTMKFIRQVTADGAGKYDFGKVECGTAYYAKAEKEGYTPAEEGVIIPNETGKTQKDLAPHKLEDKLREGVDIAKALGIKMIYFDLDKSYIRPDAAVELAKILYVMEEHPTMHIDVRSHTDCRQTYAYNMKLSDRRAKSTIQWLVDHGISKDRLTGRGYGESQLVNNCACEPTNASPCSEEEHQKNRRSEFIITKM